MWRNHCSVARNIMLLQSRNTSKLLLNFSSISFQTLYIYNIEIFEFYASPNFLTFVLNLTKNYVTQSL